MYKIQKLYESRQRLFSTQDLRLIWQTASDNTLYTTIQRYTKRKIFYKIYKGLYSLIPPAKVNVFELGSKIIGCFSYLSGESILAKHGLIFQSSPMITFISSRSMKIKVAGYLYWFRQMKDESLYNPWGIVKKETHYEANLYRALADYLYYYPRATIDNKLFDRRRLLVAQRKLGHI